MNHKGNIKIYFTVINEENNLMSCVSRLAPVYKRQTLNLEVLSSITE